MDGKAPDAEHIKGTVDEELWDVIYYALAIANLYEIDMEQVIKTKEEYLYPLFLKEKIFDLPEHLTIHVEWE